MSENGKVKSDKKVSLADDRKTEIKRSTPNSEKNCGEASVKYRMPGEFEPHDGCVMIWPERPGSWNYGAKEAQKAFVRVAEAIAESEKVYMLVSQAQAENDENSA